MATLKTLACDEQFFTHREKYRNCKLHFTQPTQGTLLAYLSEMNECVPITFMMTMTN